MDECPLSDFFTGAGIGSSARKVFVKTFLRLTTVLRPTLLRGTPAKPVRFPDTPKTARRQRHALAAADFSGGAGNRTPVQKMMYKRFYGA